MNITVAGSPANRMYDQDQIESISIELAAFDAEMASTSIPIPDPVGPEDVSGRNVLIVDNYIAGTPPTYTTFLDGFIIGRGRERGPAPTPPHRLATLNVQDANALLYGMIASKWSRPAETDVARMLAAAAAFWPTLDTSWVLGTIAGTPPRNVPVSMPAKAYDTDQIASELSADTVAASGKTMFVRSAGGVRYLHYHALDVGPAATISLDSTAPNWTTIFPFTVARRESDGLELHYKVIARNTAGNEVTVTDATSQALHNADGRAFEALLDFPDAADVTALTALANKDLAMYKDERETFFVEHVGPFTAAQAVSIGPGFLISVTSDVLGLTASTQRIAHLTWKYKHPGIWFADMELGYPLRGLKSRSVPNKAVKLIGACSYVAPIHPGLSSLDVFGGAVSTTSGYSPAASVYPSTALISWVFTGSGRTGTPGLYGTPNNGAHWGVGSAVMDPSITTARWVWDLLAAGSPAICAVQIITYGGPPGSALSLEASDDGITWTTILTGAALAAAPSWPISLANPQHRYWSLTWFQVMTGLGVMTGLDMDAVMLWGAPVTITGPGTIGGVFPLTGATVTAQTPVPAPDGSTVLFTLANPYLSGSLQVSVDGLPIPASEVAETNPVAGTFTLSWAVDADERITVTYRIG